MSDLIENIRNLAMNKQLNFLVGSGCSTPSIPLMGQIETEEGEDSNRILEAAIRNVCEILMEEEINEESKFYDNLFTYEMFIRAILNILNSSNSRIAPRNANIFTTNYDLFIEKAVDKILKSHKFVFNDGADGYFDRKLEGSNYNRTVSYRGLNDNYTNELPSISLIKPHGSMNWEGQGDIIFIRKNIIQEPFIVPPTGIEGQTTFLNNHFHEMLRVFQLELDKPQSVLFIIGFSFQDKHIGKMIKRAMQNPELLIYSFAHSNSNKKDFLENLSLKEEYNNFKIITPQDLNNNFKETLKDGDKFKEVFTLKNLTSILTI